MLLGHDDLAGYVDRPSYPGVTVGRCANRIAGARFTLDGTVHALAANDHGQSLHGGGGGDAFDRVAWRVVAVERGPVATLVPAHRSPHGAGGYPGDLDVTVTYTLDEAGTLGIVFAATTDRPTIVNMTNHAVSNPAGAGEPQGALGHRLTVPAAAYTPVDARLIPTGALAPVAGTPFDFRTPRIVADRIRDGRDPQIVAGRGYDHNFALDKGLTAAPELAARLEDPASGRVLEVLTTEPPLAREFQRHNKENRAIRPAKLKQFVDDIEGGRWELNGESMIFAIDGSMNDGQHRCEAVIQSQKSIRTIVTFGVTRESRRTVDNGSARAPGDHLSVEGVIYATETAAICRFLMAYERGKKKRLSDSNRITATEIVERALTDKRLPEAATFSKTGTKVAKSIAPPSVLGFCFYVFNKRDPKSGGPFLRSVITGINLQPDSPAYVVRERLRALDRPLREHRINLLFQAFNAFRENKPLRVLTVKPELPALV